MILEGTLSHFNYSPKGGYEAMLLTTKKGVVQVNFAPEQAAVLAATLKPGGAVSVKANRKDDTDEASHLVYELTELKQKGAAVDLEPVREVSGVVARVNFSLHGEVNGAVLNTGDFVHLKPNGARLVELAVGQSIKAKGRGRSLWFSEGYAIDAEKINGVSRVKLEQAKKAAKHAAKKAAKNATMKRKAKPE